MELLYSARDAADVEAVEQALLARPRYPIESAVGMEARRITLPGSAVGGIALPADRNDLPAAGCSWPGPRGRYPQ